MNYIDKIDDKISNFNLSKLEKPKILTYSKINSSYELKFLWCDEELKSYRNLKKKDVKKKLNEIKKKINYLNILHPNRTDSLTDKMYICLLKNNEMNPSFVLIIKKMFNKFKNKLGKLLIFKIIK